jgi:hypothetical protein
MADYVPWHKRRKKICASLTPEEYEAFRDRASAGGKTPTGMTTEVVRQFIASNAIIQPTPDDFLESPNVYGDDEIKEAVA